MFSYFSSFFVSFPLANPFLPRLDGPGQLPYSTPVDGELVPPPQPDTSAIEPVTRLCSTINSSSQDSTRPSMTLRSSTYMSLPDTGRPGTLRHTETRVHCPQCFRFLLARNLPRHMNTVHKSS